MSGQTRPTFPFSSFSNHSVELQRGKLPLFSYTRAGVTKISCQHPLPPRVPGAVPGTSAAVASAFADTPNIPAGAGPVTVAPPPTRTEGALSSEAFPRALPALNSHPRSQPLSPRPTAPSTSWFLRLCLFHVVSGGSPETRDSQEGPPAPVLHRPRDPCPPQVPPSLWPPSGCPHIRP